MSQQGITRRTMLRAGTATGTAAALGAAGLLTAGTAKAGSRPGGLPYQPEVTDTSHCTPEVALRPSRCGLTVAD